MGVHLEVGGDPVNAAAEKLNGHTSTDSMIIKLNDIHKVGFISYALLKCMIRIIISMLKDLGRVVIHKGTRRQWEVYKNR